MKKCKGQDISRYIRLALMFCWMSKKMLQLERCYQLAMWRLMVDDGMIGHLSSFPCPCSDSSLILTLKLLEGSVSGANSSIKGSLLSGVQWDLVSEWPLSRWFCIKCTWNMPQFHFHHKKSKSTTLTIEHSRLGMHAVISAKQKPFLCQWWDENGINCPSLTLHSDFAIICISASLLLPFTLRYLLCSTSLLCCHSHGRGLAPVTHMHLMIVCNAAGKTF